MKKLALDKLGSFGAVVAAAACPVCFPKLALFGAIFGFGALQQYETLLFFAAQALVLVSVLAHFMSFRKHKNKGLLSLAAGSGLLFFVSLYLIVWEYMSYLALSGLIAATIWLMLWNRRCQGCETTAS